MAKYDFGGWAWKNDVLCSDGTTIKEGCFDAQNGSKIPMVWMHNHNEIGQVIGHCILEIRPEGGYVWGKFNDAEGGETARSLVHNGDVDSLSIFANHLTRAGKKMMDIIHGSIKEVSLVIGGADPTAKVDWILEHGEESTDSAEFSGFGFPEYIYHADEEDDEMAENEEKKPAAEPEQKEGSEETVKDVFDTLTDKQKKAVAIIIDQVMKKGTPKKDDSEVEHACDTDDEDKKKEIEHSEDPEDEEDDGESDETVADVIATLSPKQKKAVEIVIGLAKQGKLDSENKEEKGDTEMKHNVFEGAETRDVISHDDMVKILKDAKKCGSLRAAVDEARESGALAHADYGIDADHTMYDGAGAIDYLFPDAKTINTTPEFIKRETDWVDEVLSATHHTPFSRVKSIFADITEDEARAKGYIKGNLKKEEVFSLIKRVTEPQTIYKKQKFDKDDIDDILDFNVVTWVKAEMQMMLREETARAVLIGDGRLSSSDDKIKEDHIRPVFNDADLFTVKYAVEVPANASEDVKAKALMKALIKSRKLYKGSGNPKFYTTEDELTDMLLLENGIGEKLYKSEAEVATAIRASKITTVEPMEGLKIGITASGVTTQYNVAGVLCNLADYNIGTNGGAKTDFFDDFDIDYNQYKYLYETRMSGALIKPFSAITFYYKEVEE